jgi:dCTP deaminase
MILTGQEIIKQVGEGAIKIDPFSMDQVNPNSYNYRLGRFIIEVNNEAPLDPTLENTQDSIEIPESGFLVKPYRFYLSHTCEKIGSTKFVPTLIGRSSIGRLGLFLQISADLGNLGAYHQWTLELFSVQPVRVYPRMVIGQVSFWTTEGPSANYSGSIGFRSEPTFAPPLKVPE